jgi:hypothetical protein
MRNVLLIAGALLPLIAAATYTYAIIRGPVRPERMTRFLLAVITGLSFVSLVAGNDHSGMWLALTSFIESLVLWVLSLWRGMGGTNRLDWLCLGLCAVGVGWWLVSGDSFVGLVASIVADLIACIPSLVKTIRLPHTESVWFYLLGVVGSAFVWIAGPYDMRSVVFPAYLLAINALFVVAIWRPKVLRRRTASEDRL